MPEDDNRSCLKLLRPATTLLGGEKAGWSTLIFIDRSHGWNVVGVW